MNTSHNVGAAAGSAAGGFLIDAWSSNVAFASSAAAATVLLAVSLAMYAMPSRPRHVTVTAQSKVEAHEPIA